MSGHDQPVDVTQREVTAGDLPTFFDHQLDPTANHMAAFGAKDPTDRDAFDARWTRILGDTTIRARTILVDGRVAGHVASFERFGDPEVTYWLGREFWGHGVATRALSDFLRDLTTRPLYARVAKDNLPSLRVAATPDVRLDEVLDAAAARVDDQFSDQPEVAARLRETIKQARARLDEGGGDRPRDGRATADDLLPVPISYRLRGGDELVVQIFELYQPGQWASFTRQVRADGTVMLPELGPIAVAGMSVDSVQELIVRRLGETIMAAPLVTLKLAGGGFEYSVHGAAGQPGAYPLDRPNVRLLEALASAGGALEGTTQIRVVRRVDTPDDLLVDPSLLATRSIDIDYDRLSHGDPFMDIVVRPYDRIFVVRTADTSSPALSPRTDEHADADR